MIINKSGIAIRLGVDKMRVVGRATQGVTLIKLDKKDSIAAVAKVVVDEDDDFEDEDNALIDDGTIMDTEDDAMENNTPEEGDVE
jgi:DNA gyrase subunit A